MREEGGRSGGITIAKAISSSFVCFSLAVEREADSSSLSTILSGNGIERREIRRTKTASRRGVEGRRGAGEEDAERNHER